MKTLCAPNAYTCHLRAFPEWLAFDHGLGIILCVILATAAAWVILPADHGATLYAVTGCRTVITRR